MINQNYLLRFTLASDAVFGSAEHSSPLVNIDIQHDRWGCPYLPGRTLKGVLREECANILFALERMRRGEKMQAAAEQLFGLRGGGLGKETILRFSDAQLPAADRQVLIEAVGIGKGGIQAKEVLDALTAFRSQTSINPMTGSARQKSLRRMRVILRETTFEAPLQFTREPRDEELALLSACVKALRRLGSSRNRGLGELKNVNLLNETGNDSDFIDSFKVFKQLLAGGTR